MWEEEKENEDYTTGGGVRTLDVVIKIFSGLFGAGEEDDE